MQSITGRSGFVIVLGRPSSGKSSLINALCGEKVSIVSPVPQTTRNTIRGIHTDSRGQIVFLDTPGFHQAEKKINLRMRDVVLESLEDTDGIVYTVDTTRPGGREEREVARLVTTSTAPRVVALTKCDHAESDPERTIAFLADIDLSEAPTVRTRKLDRFARGSGGTGNTDETGIGHLLDVIYPTLPQGEPWYPDDHYTDQEPQFRIAEIVREQAILRTREEVPHAIYVEVADLEQRPKYLWARVFIFVERSSQQGILVGKNATTITEIRRESQRILNTIFPVPVRLSVQVKTRPRWRHDDSLLKSLIQ